MTKTEQTRVRTWRLKILLQAGESARNVARTCRHFGISRQAHTEWRDCAIDRDGLTDRRDPRQRPS